MRQKDFKIARQLKNRVGELVKLIDFRVFGSRATGKAVRDSDLDIFIETETLEPTVFDRILDLAWEVGFENSIVIAPLILSKNDFDRSPKCVSSTLYNVLENGIKI
jgi:uncharacterized protein